jgi:ABC-type transport system substrate-binding protein
MLLVLGDGPDPDSFLFRYHSSEPASSNRMRIKDPKLDSMIERQRTLVNVDERKRLINEIQEYLYEQMYTPPTAEVILYKVRQPWVRMNGAADHLAGFWRTERVWLDK